MNDPSDLMIGVSGLRGIVGQGLTAGCVGLYASLCAETLACCTSEAERPTTGPIVVSRDSRPSGTGLAAAAIDALSVAGVPVVDAGIAATPTVGVLVNHLGALGALQITASHNPIQWNGVKVFTHQGRVLNAGQSQELTNRFRHAMAHEHDARTDSNSSRPKRADSVLSDPHQPHLERILSLVDAPSIARRHFHVLLDANGGTGGILGARLLERLGCSVELVAGKPDGRFLHPPEPLQENLTELCERAAAAGAAVCFALDPDSDRLALIDEMGRYLGEEYTLTLVVDHVLRSRPGPVVANLSTTRAVEDVATRYGCPLFRAKVGEANVVDAMLQRSAVIGGEGNGGVIDPRVGLVRDGFVAMALILEALAGSDKPLSVWSDALPRYHMVKRKFQIDRSRTDASLAALKEELSGADVDLTDGARWDWPDRWLQVRPSNTEPVVRVLAEAPTKTQAEALCGQAGRVLEQAV